jgi:predicted metal-binding membrane protein
MRRPARRLDPWRVALAAASLAAWSVLALGERDTTLPAFCSPGGLGVAPRSASLDLGLALNAPATLALGWLLMLTAMMTPLIVAPLRHVRDRSFARRRARAMLLFVAGYIAVWMVAGVPLQALALVVQSSVLDPLACLGLGAAAATLWQVSPAKQWCLNRCHRRPQLAAFGLPAERDALGFGLSHGAACIGACWALMALPLLFEQGQVLAMTAVAGFVFAERLERPAPLEWRWRGLGKALRITIAQARLQVAARD